MVTYWCVHQPFPPTEEKVVFHFKGLLDHCVCFPVVTAVRKTIR